MYLSPNYYLDFSNSPPTLIANSTNLTFNGYEDAISANDQNNNFIFYSNGERIWNRNFDVMPNGRNLNGWTSSSQAVVALEDFNNASQYYIFTNGQGGGFNFLNDAYFIQFLI